MSRLGVYTIRLATAADAAGLSELALRSKSYWQYDAAFLERVRSALTVTADDIAAHPTYLLEAEGCVAGFYSFRILDGNPFLYDLWVDPPFIGKGLGRALWTHLLETAGRQDFRFFLIESDPNAVDFYHRMGARRIGDRISPDSGRCLPLLRYEIASSPEDNAAPGTSR